ncbi:MAG: START-like domain-containing protein [Flavobacteriales bacterium]|nr:MAG: START-like domain-containing protein [Flavobacteriales bacterium]
MAPAKKNASAAAKGRTPSAKALPPPPRPTAAAQRPKAKPSQAAPAQAAPKPAAIAQKPAPPRTGAQPRPAERRAAKERVVMEFQVNSAPNVLYELISTPSGFSEWYCDDVNVRGDQYVFIWNGEEEAVTLIGRKAPEVIRFHRNDDDDHAAFFELRIRIDAMTNEVALIVTDHAWPNEVEATRNLWASQIANLVRVLGA